MAEKYTVLLMMPYEFHSDQPCAADCIVREWVEGESIDEAITQATAAAISREPETEPDDWAPIAVYPGHQFDVLLS
jgi:hypothetical protein